MQHYTCGFQNPFALFHSSLWHPALISLNMALRSTLAYWNIRTFLTFNWWNYPHRYRIQASMVCLWHVNPHPRLHKQWLSSICWIPETFSLSCIAFMKFRSEKKIHSRSFLFDALILLNSGCEAIMKTFLRTKGDQLTVLILSLGWIHLIWYSQCFFYW